MSVRRNFRLVPASIRSFARPLSHGCRRPFPLHAKTRLASQLHHPISWFPPCDVGDNKADAQFCQCFDDSSTLSGDYTPPSLAQCLHQTPCHTRTAFQSLLRHIPPTRCPRSPHPSSSMRSLQLRMATRPHRTFLQHHPLAQPRPRSFQPTRMPRRPLGPRLRLTK